MSATAHRDSPRKPASIAEGSVTISTNRLVESHLAILTPAELNERSHGYEQYKCYDLGQAHFHSSKGVERSRIRYNRVSLIEVSPLHTGR